MFESICIYVNINTDISLDTFNCGDNSAIDCPDSLIWHTLEKENSLNLLRDLLYLNYFSCLLLCCSLIGLFGSQFTCFERLKHRYGHHFDI